MRIYSPFGPFLAQSVYVADEHRWYSENDHQEPVCEGQTMPVRPRPQTAPGRGRTSGLKVIIPDRGTTNDAEEVERSRFRSPSQQMYERSSDLLFRSRSLHRDVSPVTEAEIDYTVRLPDYLLLPSDLPLDIGEALTKLKRQQKELIAQKWQHEWNHVRPPKSQFWSLKTKDFAHEMRLCRENNVREEQDFRAHLGDLTWRLDLENRVRKGLIKQTWEELEAGDHPVSSASAHLVY